MADIWHFLRSPQTATQPRYPRARGGLLCSIGFRAHKQKQCITIALQFLVADAGDNAELVVGFGTRRCDAFQRGVMENDVSRHAALSSHPCPPDAQGTQEACIPALVMTVGDQGGTRRSR